jgi:Restriction Enzyme Adenine Methylase Associated
VDAGPEYVLETLRLLSREEMEENRIEALWSMHYVDQAVGRALGEVFGGEADRGLVRLLGKHTTGITAKEVRSSLQRLRVDFDFPVPTLAPSLPVTDSQKKSLRVTSAKTSTTDDPHRRVSLLELIESGALRAPLEIEAQYRGTPLRATIETDGTVTMDGQSHPSLSHAGGTARMRVKGSGKAPSTNGWTFWRYRKPDGTQERLSELRDRATV